MDYSRQKQTLFGSSKGNCFATCVACAFNIPIDNVPNFCGDYGDNWWNEFISWLRKRGWTAIFFDGPSVVENPRDLDGVLMIVSGAGTRGCDHAVLWKNGKMIHDPHPDGTGILNIKDVTILIPLDPSNPKIHNLL